MSPSKSKLCTDTTTSQKVHTLAGIIFIIFVFGLLGLVYVIDQRLPASFNVDHEELHPDSFITERARTGLKSLTDLGPRITGGQTNEILAVNLLKTQIGQILSESKPGKKLETDVQLATGSFQWFGIGNSYINAYANVQNVLVKLHGKGGGKISSLLVNAHFDSKPLGEGGSDDGINCANMLEVLRKLSKSDEDLVHDLVFLFNGSEEPGLQGSHAFITQHKWAQDVKAVVNLDAAGAGGKLTVFRMGPKRPWLMNYYSKLPYPTGQVLAEEVFGTGIIPSDTDFSVFTQIGGLTGFDLGYYQDGYRYHTSYDGYENIPNGTFHHGGENVLSLVRFLGNAPEMALSPEEASGDDVVYYDFLGVFMVHYSETVAIGINLATVVVFIVAAVKVLYDLQFHSRGLSDKLKYLTGSLGVILIGWIFGAVFALIIASILDTSKQSLSWFSNIWLLVGLYGVPVFTVSCSSIVVLNYMTRKMDISNGNLIQALVVTFIWAIVLLLGTFLNIRSVCFVQVLVALQTVSFIAIVVAKWQDSAKKWPVIYILCSIIPNLIIMTQAVVTLIFFVPVTGRMGSTTNPEMLICGITVFYTLLATSIYAPLIGVIRKPLIVLGVLTSIFVLFFVLALTPVGFPYRDNSGNSPRPQRYWMHHTSRTFRDESNKIYKSDGGFYLANLDRNAPIYVASSIAEFVNVSDIKEDCERSLFCGIPMAKLRNFGVTWISAEKPKLQKQTTLTLNSKVTVTDLITRFSFSASGLDHLEIYVSPKHSADLIHIDLIEGKPNEIQTWNERPVYVIEYTCGKKAPPLNFSIDIQTATPNYSKPLIDIALVARYLHIDTNIKTPQYEAFVAQFPSWADVVPWLAEYQSWVY